MKRILFFLCYAFALCCLAPGLVIAKIQKYIQQPAAWQEALILCSWALAFALLVALGAWIYRKLKLDFPLPDTDWRSKRITTIPFPGSAPASTQEAPRRNRYFCIVTLLVVSLFWGSRWGVNSSRLCEHLIHGYYLSADICTLLGVKPKDRDLHIFCNNNRPIFSSPEKQARAVRYLLEHGCNPNARDWGERPALWYALFKENQHLLPILLEYGADINYQTHCDNINNQLFYESPPLVRAAEEDDIELLRYLLAHGADANVKSYDQTALHIICNANSQNLQESVRLLLAADADINVLDAKGRTPLDLLEKSTRHENSENMSRNREFLIQHGARHASELPISLNPAESDITAKLKAANPNADDTELAGVILHNKGAIPYTYSQTSKGNGFITVPGREGKLDIRCHDAHNDGTIYQHYWAQISLEDKNADQHRDIVVSYTLLQLDDNDQEISQEPHSQVYIWDPVENVFLAP